MFKNPTTDIQSLKDKQKIIKSFMKDKTMFKIIQEKLDQIAELQNTLLWTLKEKTIEEEKIFNNVYFNSEYLKPFNSNEEILNLYSLFKIIFSPIYGVLSPVLFFIVPYIYLYFFTNIKFDFQVYFKILKMSFFGMTFGSKPGITRYLSCIIIFYVCTKLC